MKALFFKNNVYVSVEDKSPIDITTMENDSSFIGYLGRTVFHLYGSRVLILPDSKSEDGSHFFVDGIVIHEMEEYFTLSISLSPVSVVAFLNEIENLGIDSFLEHYKKSLETFKEELRQLKTEYTQDNSIPIDESRIKFIKNIEEVQSRIICILFSLSLHRNAGLENHVYTETYNSIINQFFQ